MKHVTSKSSALLGLALAVVGNVAQAQSSNAPLGPYVEIGYMPWSYTEAYSGQTYTWNSGAAVRAIFGMDVHENLAVEALYAADTTDATVTIGSYSSATNWASTYGVYAKPNIDVSKDVNLFARVGYAVSSLSASPTSTRTRQLSSDSISYGLGASYRITKSVSINGDYMVYYQGSPSVVSGYTLGLGFNF
ncbi:MAG: porin family protein [Betaproteobacteria bacterium]|nr:porin family protein [Betaproteobacteria bacterium]